MFSIIHCSLNKYKETQLFCNTITKRNCEVYSEKTALFKQLQQLVEEKNKLQHQLKQAKKETDNFCEHLSEYVMESEQQTEVLKHNLSVTQLNEEELEIERCVLHDVQYIKLTCDIILVFCIHNDHNILVLIRDAILNRNYELMKQLEVANHKLNNMIDKHKETTEELELSTKRFIHTL